MTTPAGIVVAVFGADVAARASRRAARSTVRRAAPNGPRPRAVLVGRPALFRLADCWAAADFGTALPVFRRRDWAVADLRRRVLTRADLLLARVLRAAAERAARFLTPDLFFFIALAVDRATL
jgi:hypothetical protein